MANMASRLPTGQTLQNRSRVSSLRNSLLSTAIRHPRQSSEFLKLDELTTRFAFLCCSRIQSYHRSHSLQTRRVSAKRTPKWARTMDGSKKVSPSDFKMDNLQVTASTTPLPRLAPRIPSSAGSSISDIEKQIAQTGDRTMTRGRLADNSFFAPQRDNDVDTERWIEEEGPDSLSIRNMSNMQRIVNPRPNARLRWQRKMIIREVKQERRLPKEVWLARTECSHLSQSHFWGTSVKKLTLLARQIAGKSVDEAILQMRFSKKKAAREVRDHLVQARDEAIVRRGMGLSLNNIAEIDASNLGERKDVDSQSAESEPTPNEPIKSPIGPKETEIYVAQAWVNRGPYGREPEFRARGRVNILRPPSTGITLLLKEEKTRAREAREKQEREIQRRVGQGMWKHMPDKKIYRQSQCLLW